MQAQFDLHTSDLPRIEHLTGFLLKTLAHGVLFRVVLAIRLSD
jgi:hypothetical protein